MARQRRLSNASSASSNLEQPQVSTEFQNYTWTFFNREIPLMVSSHSHFDYSNSFLGHLQELGSMYDYLAKVILLGPSGAGKFVSSISPLE